jgi:hypothetical protein
VIRLSVTDDNQVRDAARSYLRAANIVSDDVARMMDRALTTDLASLRAAAVAGKPYHKDYLLLIAARDVYYNLGLNKLDIHANAMLAGRKGDLAAVIDAFEKGRALRMLAANDRERISLSKNTYGRALAEYRHALLTQAIALAGKDNPADVIARARATAAPVQDQTAQTTFKALLDEVKADASLYPWPAHLDQARRCIEKLTFACLGGEALPKD